MIVTPKTRGFICTTAHPTGCAKNVEIASKYAMANSKENGPKKVLVLGASTGYGLAGRISATFSYGADTVGVFFEKPASGKRTATAGWYNNIAFEKLAKQNGHVATSINGDAFSDEIKAETIEAIKRDLGGKVDIVLYSLASPRRTDPKTGDLYSSVIKPIGDTFKSKTVDFHTGEVSQVEVEPATETEVFETTKVMGGEDWLMWIEALKGADVLAENVTTIALSYIGPKQTHAVYKDGTIGKAKEDIEAKAKEITELLKPISGKGVVSVNKALVTQSSSAIPVVPLYIAILFKIMKEQGTHEVEIQQMVRMFDKIFKNGTPNWDNIDLDSKGRLRLDDLEMEESVQSRVMELWDKASTENLEDISDIKGYQHDFFSLFGFGLDDIDYNAEVDIEL